MNKEDIKSVLDKHQSKLMSIEGVFGVAIGKKNNEACIQVHLSDELSGSLSLIPSTIEGYPVEIIKMSPPTID